MGPVLRWWASFWLRVLWGKEPEVSYELRSSVGAADKELKHGGVTVVGCIPAMELELVWGNYESNMLITCSDVGDVVLQLWFVSFFVYHCILQRYKGLFFDKSFVATKI
jgi:hypothetical protein